MKIAMMTNNYKPFVGGVPISIERLAAGLETLGHRVYIFAPDYAGVCQQREEKDVIRYRSFSKKLSDTILIPNSFDPAIPRKIKALDVDLIHVHHPMLMGNTALHLSRKLDIPLVYTYHTRYEEYVHYLIREQGENGYRASAKSCCVKQMREHIIPGYMRYFADCCDMVIAPSREMKRDMERRGIEAPVEVLPTGIPEAMYYPDRSRAEQIREKYLDGRKFLFCTVSRLSREKNIAFMLRGLSLLKQQMGDVFRFLIIGDGPEREPLQKLCKELGLAENVIFAGQKANETLKEYQGACDLFLFASTSETQGIVLLEAMAAGLPVVAVAATGVNDVVVNGKNGFATAEDTGKWAAAIARAIRDEGHMGALGQGAYEAARTYSARNISARGESLYYQVLERRWKEDYQMGGQPYVMLEEHHTA